MPAASYPIVRIVPTHVFPPGQALPFYTCRVPAGFPSPAEDHLGDTLDVSALLIKRPSATFFVRVSGESLKDIGVHDDDILVVDRSLTPRSGQVVIAVVDGEMTAKILERSPQGVKLLPANPRYEPITLQDGQALEVWGVVTGLVRTGMTGGIGDRPARRILCTRELPICLLSMYIQWHETANLAAAAQL